MVCVEKIKLIQSLEEMLINSEIRKSEEKLNELLADDFMEFSSTGKIYSKIEIIQALINENEIQYIIHDFKINSISEKNILATYIAIKNEKIKSLRSSIWQLQNNNQWQMLFHQGTIIQN